MPPKELFTQLSLWIVNLYPKSYIFCLHFILFLTCVDPEYGSGSTTLSLTILCIQGWTRLDDSYNYSKITAAEKRGLHYMYSSGKIIIIIIIKLLKHNCHWKLLVCHYKEPKQTRSFGSGSAMLIFCWQCYLLSFFLSLSPLWSPPSPPCLPDLWDGCELTWKRCMYV